MTTRTITVDKASPAEFQEILDVINRLNKESMSQIIPPEHFLDPFLTMEQLVKMSTVMDFYVHWREEVIIGVSSFGKRNDTTAWIPLLYVLSEYQRQGIASAMASHLETMAKELGYNTIQLETDDQAEWALSFYRNRGYVIVEKEPNPWGFHVWLEKKL